MEEIESGCSPSKDRDARRAKEEGLIYYHATDHGLVPVELGMTPSGEEIRILP